MEKFAVLVAVFAAGSAVVEVSAPQVCRAEEVRAISLSPAAAQRMAQPSSVAPTPGAPPAVRAIAQAPSSPASTPSPELNLHGPVNVDGTPQPQPAAKPTASPSSSSGAPVLREAIPNGENYQAPPNIYSAPSQTAGPPVLKAAAQIANIKATAANLSASPLTRNRDLNLKYVQLTVKNDSNQICIILGNAVHASVGGEDLPVAPPSAAEMSDRPHLNTKGNLLVLAATAGTLGLAAPMVYENLTPDQHAKRSLGTPIGRDGSRFEVEATHFGERVIMPGDQTSGWIAFPCPQNRQVTKILVPVSYTRSAISAGSLEVPVAQTASK